MLKRIITAPASQDRAIELNVVCQHAVGVTPPVIWRVTLTVFPMRDVSGWKATSPANA